MDAGPFLGKMFLIIVDAHFKWIDAHIMSSITATQTFEKLRIVFANHGLPRLPRKVVTDNGSSFTSDEFRTFMSRNGIVHVTTAPYHPSSNGLAERAVQTVKRTAEPLSKKDCPSFCSPIVSLLSPQLVFHLLLCSWDDASELV